MKAFFGLGLAVLLLICTGCAEDSKPTHPIDFLPLTGITINSQYPQIANHTTNQFTAAGDFSGVFTEDVTDRATWSVDNAAVLEIDANTGFATALTPGTVIVTATVGETSADLEFIVTNAFITGIEITQIDPAPEELPVGLTQSFRAIGTFSDETKQIITHLVGWSSTNESVAIIDDSGVARAIASGFTRIGATFREVTGEFVLTVTSAKLLEIAIVPGEVILAPMDPPFPLRVNGFFSDDSLMDITSHVQWLPSDNPSVATVSETGIITAVAPGEATITATRNGMSASILVTVASLESITISVKDDEGRIVAVGETIQLLATGIYVSGEERLERDITSQAAWESTNDAVATVGNEEGSKGVVTGVAPSLVRIEATRHGQTSFIEITVIP